MKLQMPHSDSSMSLRTLEKHVEKPLQSLVLRRTTKPDSSAMVTDSLPMPWAIPAIVKNNDKGLEDVSIDTLEKTLQPVLQGLQSLRADDILDLEHVPEGSGAEISPTEFVKPIHHEITPSCNDGTVRYVHLSEAPGQYSIGIFIFPPHSIIPLHDHPGMCVLSRVLYGTLTRRSFDLSREHAKPQPQPTASSWLSWSKHTKDPLYQEGTRLAYRNRIDTLSAPGCTMLFPFEGNLHEFVAGEQGAAVLDVLLPPYDPDHHRDCTFYDIQPCSRWEQHDTQREAVWAVPTPQPESFHCISGSYRGLGCP